MKHLMAIIAIMVISIFCGIAFIFYQAGYRNGQLNTLPTQSEIQEALGVEVDGVIGPESRRVWDAAIEQRETDEWITPIMTAFNKEFDKECLNGMDFD